MSERESFFAYLPAGPRVPRGSVTRQGVALTDLESLVYCQTNSPPPPVSSYERNLSFTSSHEKIAFIFLISSRESNLMTFPAAGLLPPVPPLPPPPPHPFFFLS